MNKIDFGTAVSASADYLVSQLAPANSYIIAIDASGGINIAQTNTRLAAVFNAIMRQTTANLVVALTFTSEVGHATTILRRETPKMRLLAGGGGSDLNPVIDFVRAFNNPALIVLSDGYMPDIKQHQCQIAWLMSIPLSSFHDVLPGVQVFENDDRYMLLGNGPNLWDAA